MKKKRLTKKAFMKAMENRPMVLRYTGDKLGKATVDHIVPKRIPGVPDFDNMVSKTKAKKPIIMDEDDAYLLMLASGKRKAVKRPVVIMDEEDAYLSKLV